MLRRNWLLGSETQAGDHLGYDANESCKYTLHPTLNPNKWRVYLVDLIGAATGSCIEQLRGTLLLLPGQQRLRRPSDPRNVSRCQGWGHVPLAGVTCSAPHK